MKLLILSLLLTLTSGCRFLTYEGSNGEKFTSRSFGNATTLGELTVRPDGTVTLKNYNNDQVQGLGIVTESAVKAAISSAK